MPEFHTWFGSLKDKLSRATNDLIAEQQELIKLSLDVRSFVREDVTRAEFLELDPVKRALER